MKQKIKIAIILITLLVVIAGNIALFLNIGWDGFAFYSMGLSFLIVRDYVKTKRPFDKKKEMFDLYDDWIIWIYDDILLWNLGGMIGAGLSSEVFMPLLVKYMDWPEMAEVSLTDTAIIVCTILGARVLNRVINSDLRK